MQELVVISGKGGTGKTSVIASFAALAERAVLADCDVDAADLHLLLAPEVRQREPFSGGKEARIDSDRCAACGQCAAVCSFDAITMDGPATDVLAKTYRVDPLACEGCGVCVRVCPTQAIRFEDAENGVWFVSDTRHGPMVHARLNAGGENSGKLVTRLRKEARLIAERDGRSLILADGSPGIGCPVIASISGATQLLVVTEPTQSALHDLRRVSELARHFDVPAAVCVNKADINGEVAVEIEEFAAQTGLPLVGRVPYDPAVTAAQLASQSVVECGDGPAAAAIREVWTRTCRLLGEADASTRDGGHNAFE
jgi:MinD superfamily P-loop ATPase